MKAEKRDETSLHEEVDLLANLRSARALILRDAESFHEASTLLEYIGQILSGQIRSGLGQYEQEIVDLACRSQNVSRVEMDRLFNVVRNARNMAVHQGAWARHLSTRLVDLFLVLEEAIVSGMTHVEDLMVRTPVVAYGWQRVADVRKAMLTNAFSAIPIQSGRDINAWQVLSDAPIVRMLNTAQTTTERNQLLAMRIDSAIEQGLITPDQPMCCHPAALISEVVPQINNLPILVVEGQGNKQRLLGILTAFDLL